MEIIRHSIKVQPRHLFKAFQIQRFPFMYHVFRDLFRVDSFFLGKLVTDLRSCSIRNHLRDHFKVRAKL